VGEMEIADERRRSFKLHDFDVRAEQGDGELHDRMPVILAEIDWPKWLGEEPASEQDLLALLKPLSFPEIISARIRAMRQNQRMIRHDAPQSVWDVCRQLVQVAAPA
jgi:hypothetical protein